MKDTRDRRRQDVIGNKVASLFQSVEPRQKMRSYHRVGVPIDLIRLDWLVDASVFRSSLGRPVHIGEGGQLPGLVVGKLARVVPGPNLRMMFE